MTICNRPFRIAIAGLGTVGSGVVKLLSRHREKIETEAGRKIEIVAVSTLNPHKERSFTLSDLSPDIVWTEQAKDLATFENVDAIIELIGGSSGVAYDLSEQALQRQKHLVTANKALLAEKGKTLWQLAKKHRCVIAYEAAVAGGVPIIAALRDGLVANQITKVYGIINGTCNLILSRMHDDPKPIDELIRTAQQQGFAERSPEADVDGFDSAHKIVLIAQLIFSQTVPYDRVHIEGIRGITTEDIHHAKTLGYVIKLLGTTEIRKSGEIAISVMPTLIPSRHLLASVGGVVNCVSVNTEPAGEFHFIGAGAGSEPTASAVVADIIRLARYHTGDSPSVVSKTEKPIATVVSIHEQQSQFYVRLQVLDTHGVMVKITEVLAKHGISIASLVQYCSETPWVRLVLVTHPTSYRQIQQTLADLKALSSPLNPSQKLLIDSQFMSILNLPTSQNSP